MKFPIGNLSARATYKLEVEFKIETFPDQCVLQFLLLYGHPQNYDRQY
jgi:hypothetical protein